MRIQAHVYCIHGSNRAVYTYRPTLYRRYAPGSEQRVQVDTRKTLFSFPTFFLFFSVELGTRGWTAASAIKALIPLICNTVYVRKSCLIKSDYRLSYSPTNSNYRFGLRSFGAALCSACPFVSFRMLVPARVNTYQLPTYLFLARHLRSLPLLLA